jgi:hypothetical protein
LRGFDSRRLHLILHFLIRESLLKRRRIAVWECSKNSSETSSDERDRQRRRPVYHLLAGGSKLADGADAAGAWLRGTRTGHCPPPATRTPTVFSRILVGVAAGRFDVVVPAD